MSSLWPVVLRAILLSTLGGCGYLGFELQNLEGDGSRRAPTAPIDSAETATPTTPDGGDSTGSTDAAGGSDPGDATDLMTDADAAVANETGDDALMCDLGTLDHCGACDNACLAAEYAAVAALECMGNACVISTCEPDFADCDGLRDNGCESSTETSEHCGACDRACSAPNAALACDAGACVITQCEGLFADCDGDASNGCERPINTINDCGGCDIPCSASATETECSSGVCTAVSCYSGFGDCDGDPLGNGCETALNTLSDCGSCGVPCTVQAGTASCSGGTCTGAGCDSAFADCDGDSLTCETALDTLTDCGGCGVSCGSGGRLPNATATCATQTCQIAGCDSLYGNCDGLVANGCETSFSTLANCGACGRTCSVSNGSATCTTGSCAIASCNSGYGDCANGSSDGCETPLTTTDNCGACGRSCSGDEQCVDGDCIGYAYDASNFPEDSIDAAQGPSVTLNCGVTTFSSSTLTFSNSCGQTEPAAVVVSQSGSGEDLVVLPLRTLTIATGSTLRLEGNRPVALAAAEDVTVSGTLYASASGTTAGPGGNRSCGTSGGYDGSGSPSTGGGGGGGGFANNGGSGGYGDSNGNQGYGGQARGNASLIPLLGGCGGGYGGGCSNNRGAGGGAVQVSAGGHLRVTGAVYANASSGSNGCGSEGGGAGGGSGGGILLEGQQLTVSGTVQANGGDGGNGANGGNGGNGASASNSAGDGASDGTNGGGGGGGATGRIQLRGIESCSFGGANLSPNAASTCP